MRNLVIIQRACANFRVPFFDILSDRYNLSLFSSSRSLGKIKVPDYIKKKKYYTRSINFSFNHYNVYPFLFIDLLKISPDIIVSEGGQNTINNLSVLLYAKIKKKRFYIWDLGKSHIEPKKSFVRKIYTCIYDYIIKNSNGILTYNSQGEKYFKDKFPLKKITVLNNTIDTNEVISIKSKINIEKQNSIIFKFKTFKYKIMFVGAINQHKNLEFLKDFIIKMGENTCIIIIGDGEKKYVEHLKGFLLFPNVFFEGYKTISECVYYYNICDFSILPGLGGLSINQSLAFGVPVLVNKADGSEYDLILDGITGYRYKNTDDLVKFVKNQSLNNIIKMKQSSIELINNKFTIEKMVQLFMIGVENYE